MNFHEDSRSLGVVCIVLLVEPLVTRDASGSTYFRVFFVGLSAPARGFQSRGPACRRVCGPRVPVARDSEGV